MQISEAKSEIKNSPNRIKNKIYPTDIAVQNAKKKIGQHIN